MKHPVLAQAKDADRFGEALREAIFEEPVGCYSCFDVNEGFRQHQPGSALYASLLEKLVKHSTFEPEDGTPTCYSNGEVSAMWFWDGDGTLLVELRNGSGTISAINTDCKKDHCWQWLQHNVNDAVDAAKAALIQAVFAIIEQLKVPMIVATWSESCCKVGYAVRKDGKILALTGYCEAGSGHIGELGIAELASIVANAQVPCDEWLSS